MEVNIEEIGPCRNRIQVKLPSEKVSDTFNKHYQDLRKSVQVKGFRPGKVPLSFLQRKFGSEIAKQVKLDLVEESLGKVFEDHQLDPVGDPEIDLKKILVEPEQGLEFEAIVEVRPTFELGTYAGIEVEKPSDDVTDEDVDDALNGLLRRNASLEPVEGDAVGEEDVLFGTVTLLADERQLVKDHEITIGPKTATAAGIVVENLRQRAVETGVGGTATFDVTVPRFFPMEEHRGKDAKLILSLQEAKTPVLPALDDDFAKQLDFDDLNELKEKVTESLAAEKTGAADRELENRILEKVIDGTPFSLPEGLVNKETDRLLARARLEMEFAGKSPEEIEEASAEVAAGQKDQVEHSLKGSFLLDAIAKKEKIFVTEDEVNRHLEMVGAREGKSVEDVRAHYEERDLLGEVRFHLREAKTRVFLREQAKTS